MSIETWTDEQLDMLYEIARKATGGEWEWGCTPTKTVNAAVRWAAKTIRASEQPGLWEVFAGSPDAPVVIALTGNGPTSEANCQYLNAVQPRNIRSIIEHLLHARRQVRDLQAQLDYAREQLEKART